MTVCLLILGYNVVSMIFDENALVKLTPPNCPYGFDIHLTVRAFKVSINFIETSLVERMLA